MDKPQYLVFGILAIAVGFFALRFTADDLDDYDDPYAAGGEYAMAGGEDYGEDRFGSSGGRMVARERGASGSRSSRFGSGSGSGGRDGSGSSRNGRNSAETVAGKRGDRRSHIGGRSGIRNAKEIARATSLSGSSKNSDDRSKSASGSRSERLEQLVGKDAKVDPFYDGDDIDDNPDDNVLLDVKSKEDVDRKANSREGVDVSDDGSGIQVGEDGHMTFPNVANANIGSVSLDITPNWNGADITDNSFMQIRQPHQWENSMQLVKNGQFLRFIVRDDGGHESDISFKITDWPQGDAKRITASWEDGVINLYVDNRRVGTNTYPGTIDFGESPILLGGDHAGGSYNGLDGNIDNFQVFKDATGGGQLG